MNKAILLLSLLAPVAYATPITPTHLIYPGKAELQAACDAGYRHGSAGKLGMTPEFGKTLTSLPRKPTSLLGSKIVSGFQLPADGIYSECSLAGFCLYNEMGMLPRFCQPKNSGLNLICTSPSTRKTE